MAAAIDLTDRVAVVTGAGAGIGRAIADQLARAGAHIAVLERNAESSAAAATELARHGTKTLSVPTDVSDRPAVDAAFARVNSEFGRIDALVNNAGVSHVGPFTQDVTDEAWHETLAVMQTGVFYCMRAAGRLMLQQRSGSIVNIASIRGFSPNPGRLAYCAVKAAVIMMTKVAAGEWTPAGTRQRHCPRRGAHADVGSRRRGRSDRRAALSQASCRPDNWVIPPTSAGWRLPVLRGCQVHQRLDRDDRRRADLDPGRLIHGPRSDARPRRHPAFAPGWW